MIRAYLPPLIIAALICGGLVHYVKLLAERFHLFDWPGGRKIHLRPVPRLGGVAIGLSFLLLAVGYTLASDRLSFSPWQVWLFDKRLLGVMIGLLILLLTGIVDDLRGVSPLKKLFWQAVAALCVVAAGVSVNFIRLPFGLHWDLATWQIPVNLWAFHFSVAPWADLISALWLLLMINTFNFLDGLDGLATGVAAIAALMIFVLSFLLGQDANALLAVLIVGVCLGFLPWNFNPARIFLGDSGSMSLGFLVGVLALVSGGKLATAFLVLGLPVLDAFWVIFRRLFHHSSPFLADKKHLHHRLLAVGLSQRQAVLILYFVALIFGLAGVLTKTPEKVAAVLVLAGLMMVLALFLVIGEWKKRRSSDG